MKTWNFVRAACAAALFALPALAHGYAGERFFPPTITTDDPFAADELALPTVTAIKGDEGNFVSVGFELDKLVLPNLSVGVGTAHDFIRPGRGERRQNGWENVELNVKYNALVNEPHEFVLALGLESEIGGTGSRRIGRESTSTFSPAVFFGKGFGDLPDSMDWFKPLALTGVVAQNFTTGGDEPNTLEWGFSLQYQLPYLQSHVKDVGLRGPLKDLIPLVEFAFETTENRGRGITTGTINPGVLYETRFAQFGVEALVPINRDSGTHVGVVFQIWIFLDDLMPKAFGHPVFGGER